MTTSLLTKNSIIHTKINTDLKKCVERVFSRLGMTMSEAITLYLSQVKLTKDIPFAIKKPNKTTLKIFKETDKEKNIIKAKNVREIFEKAGF